MRHSFWASYSLVFLFFLSLNLLLLISPISPITASNHLTFSSSSFLTFTCGRFYLQHFKLDSWACRKMKLKSIVSLSTFSPISFPSLLPSDAWAGPPFIRSSFLVSFEIGDTVGEMELCKLTDQVGFILAWFQWKQHTIIIIPRTGEIRLQNFVPILIAAACNGKSIIDWDPSTCKWWWKFFR